MILHYIFCCLNIPGKNYIYIDIFFIQLYKIVYKICELYVIVYNFI